MRFLVDAQLPPALARFLASLGEESVHVLDIGLLEASDSTIWSYAVENQWVIITKDDDFQFRASVSPQPPMIVWVRVGNCSKQRLLDLFKQYWTTVKEELEAGALLVEIV
jgi:predicted nuclease of predicted toxin-antitoxin system